MKSNIPWSVKGIDPEAREAAKVAARRAGMTLGEWLNSLILQSGELPEGLAQQIGALVDEEDESDEDGGGASEESSEAAEELQSRLENLNRKLDQSERQQLAVSGIDESIERLASTIESSRRLLASGENAQKAIGDLSHRVERIHARLEEVAQQHRSGIEPKTLMALERAIAGVATHIEKSDRRNTELVQSVEDALSQLGSRVDGAESTANDAVGRIDLALDRMGGRIDTSESEQRRNSARLNERLSQIDERLAHAGVERETTLSTVERRLANFDAKLQSAQTRMETAAAARPNIPPDVMTRMEFEDWSRRQASELGSDTSSVKRTVSAIEARLTGLMDRIDRLRHDTEGQMRETERKADEASRQSESQAKTIDSQTVAAIGDVRSSVEEIAQKLDRTNHTTTETMSALEGVLRSLTRRLDVIEGRSGRIAEAPVLAEPPAVSVNDLPKRPTWSWGTTRQQTTPGPETSAPEVEATIEEPAEETKTRAAAFDEHGARARAGKHGVVEIIAEPAGPSPETDTGEEEDIFEATFTREEQAANAAGVDVEESSAQHEASKREGGVDLSNLVFNLKGARETAPEADDWRAEEDGWRDSSERIEPTIDTEPTEDSTSSDSGAWLEQARRAAKAAGPGERISDFGIEDEEHSPARAILITLVVLVLLIAVAATGWFVVRPWLAKSNLLGGAPSATTTSPQNDANGPSSAPTANDALGTPSLGPRSGSDATDDGYATPSETDIGQPLPGEEGTEPPLAAGQDNQGASAPGNPSALTPSTEGTPSDTATTPPTTENTAPATPQSTSEAPVSAEDALNAAANSGNARAQYALALAYKNGRGVTANSVQALTLMKKAADQNLAVAQRTLGIWYEQGDSVDKDIAQARVWYEKAANRGDVQAMHNLGFFYAEGMGGLKRDGEAAERWFKEAAEKGLVASQVNLAIIYSQSASYNMPPRMDQAYFWSAVAAKRGDQEAERMRDALAGALVADVKTQMDQAVQKWTAKSVDIVANGGFDASPDAFVPASDQPALTRAEMTNVQEMLNELGFNAGAADGHPGAQTETAIKAFQADYGLPQTGVANRDLLAALNAIPH